MTLESRFWAKVDKSGSTPTHRPGLGRCWVWTAYRTRFGYGEISVGRADEGTILAHRLSWILHKGPILDRLHVLHKCDNPSCVRPRHLFLGTQSDNNRDMTRKGRGRPIGLRWRRGEAHSGAKLTTADVLEIRASAESLASCARRYNVSKKLILLVRQRKAWKHV